jgi:chromate transporter
MPPPSIAKLFFSFLRLGLTAFGGPAMIAYIKELSVKRNKWLDEERFKDGVVLCQSIPGATAMQMAGYVGLKTKGVGGALASYVGFGLPAFMLMLLFSILYAGYHTLSFVHSLFAGLQIIVVAIIAQATYSFGKNIVKDYRDIFLVILSAGSLTTGVSPFLVIPGAGLAGIILFRTIRSSSPVPDRIAGKWKFRQMISIVVIFLIGLATLYFGSSPKRVGDFIDLDSRQHAR